MAILLTGGTGFIGSHIAVELIQSGYETVIIDNLSNSKESVLDGISKITDIRPTFYPCDVSDKDALRKVFNAHKISTVIHLAGLKSVEESVKDPDKYYFNNIEATSSLVNVMKEYDVNEIIFSSSATVYGSMNPCPYVETMELGDFANPYAKSKAQSEEILANEAKTWSELSVVILRYFNPAGAHPSGFIGEDPPAIPKNLMPLMCQVAAGELKELTIFGMDYDTPDGTCKRDYLHVVDLAKGHLKAVDYAKNHCGISIFNLGMGRPQSVMEIIEAFEEVNGIKIPYRIGARREGDLPEVWANVEKAKTVLNWETLRGIQDICRDAWHWQTSYRSSSE